MLQNTAPFSSALRGAKSSLAQFHSAPPSRCYDTLTVISAQRRVTDERVNGYSAARPRPMSPPPHLPSCVICMSSAVNGVSDGSLRRRNRDSRRAVPSYSRTVEDDALLLFSLQPRRKTRRRRWVYSPNSNRKSILTHFYRCICLEKKTESADVKKFFSRCRKSSGW